MQDCIFCKIVKGEIPCLKVYEDDNVLAFLDINPVNEGHTVVIPKKHVPNYFDLDDETYNQLNKATKQIAKKLETLNQKRICQAVLGFDVDHAHVHLIPGSNMSDLNGLKGTPTQMDKLKETLAKIETAKNNL